MLNNIFEEMFKSYYTMLIYFLIAIIFIAFYKIVKWLINPAKERYNGIQGKNKSIPGWFRKDDDKY